MVEAWYDIHGLIKIYLHVSEKNSAKIIDTLLASFRSAPIDASQVNLEFLDSLENHHYQNTLHTGGLNYSIDEQAVWDSHCTVRAEPSGKISIFSDSGIDQFVLTLLMMVQLTRQGFALCHAMGIAKEDGAIIFPAWKHTGKTGLFSYLMHQESIKLLGDELMIISRQGEVYKLPYPINIQHYHASERSTALGQAFRKKRNIYLGRMIGPFYDYIARPIITVLSLISPGLVRSIRRFALSRWVTAPLEEIVSADRISNRASLRKVITLVRSSGEKIKIDPYDYRKIIPEIISMLYCGELFSSPNVERFLQYWLVLYAFNAVESWQSILSALEQFLEEALMHAQCYRITIPEKTQISELGRFVEGVI